MIIHINVSSHYSRQHGVIKWFNNIMDKPNCRFVQFDIAEFYPSISKDLLLQALEFGRNYSDITENDTAVIMNARKSLLFYNESFWVKLSVTENDLPQISQRYGFSPV